MPGDEPGGCWLLGDDFYDILTVPVSGLPKEGLFFVVVVVGVENKLGLVFTIGISGYGVGDGPAGEGPRRLLDVILTVVGMTVRDNNFAFFTWR